MARGRSDSLGDAFSDVMARARRGDADAVAAIFSCYHGSVRAAVRQRLPAGLRSKYDTADVAQSVFTDLIRGLPRIEDLGERAFLRLLTRRVENKVRDKMRRHLGAGGRRAEKRLETDDDRLARDDDAARTLDSLDELAKMRRQLDGLDVTSLRVLQQHVEGRTFSEIAEALELSSADAARKRHERTVAALRRRWASAARPRDDRPRVL